jgi:hypothetical protein
MATGSSNRTTLSIILLALLAVAIFIFIVFFANYLTQPASSPTQTIIPLLNTLTPSSTASATSTSTITLTPRPTWTLRPSATVTLTPTPTSTSTATLINTLTPAVPNKYNTFYELKLWDLAAQTNTIELLNANTVLVPSADNFRALAYGEGEANIRFPQAADAVKWRWDRAYNLARINDPAALPLYADLIKSAVESGQVQASNLPTWFQQYESRLTLVVNSFPPQPGELGRALVELRGAGSAYLWLVENPAQTNVFPLINDFNFDQPHQNGYLYTDLTGNNIPILVIYRQTNPGSTLMIRPHFFDLSASPPTELPVQDQVPVDFGLEPSTEVSINTDSSAGSKLEVTNIMLPACPTFASQSYQWNGSAFGPSALKYGIIPDPNQLAYCEVALDTASSSWGPEAAIAIATPLLELWPPDTDTLGHPYPLDAYDQLRYRLGVLQALANHPTEAIQTMNAIVDTPTIPASAWVTPAEEFLRNYQTPSDLYKACQQAQFCNLHDAFVSMLTYENFNTLSDAMTYLQNNRVVVRSSSLFDFDQDGVNERWMIILPKPAGKLEFWILAESDSGVRAVFVQNVLGNESPPYFHQPAGTVPVIQLELQKGFLFSRLIETGEPYIAWVDVEYARPTIIRDGYNQALNALMDGGDPAKILNILLSLFDSPRFSGDCIAFRICEQFHYTLALTYDLTGSVGNAIDEYMWVWRNYGLSSFATLARTKMNYFPLPTYTRTPFPTSTLIPTRTVTPTRTITLTPTVSMTPTVTQTPTITPTPTETPTSTVTPTVTSTQTVAP